MVRTHDGSHGPDCFGCKIRMVNLHVPAFRPHFNHAVGRYVSSSRDFDEALARGAEEQNTSYSRLDPGDYESITPDSDTEAIESSRRAYRDAGLTPGSPTSTIAL
jgi:hypothetical protein